MAIKEKSYGPKHPDIASSLNNLAGLLQTTNRFSEAEPLYRRALTILEKSFGKNHPRVATNLNNMAVLFYATNRYSDADWSFRRALRILEKSLGQTDPYVANVRGNLAELLDEMGQSSDALTLESMPERGQSLDGSAASRSLWQSVRRLFGRRWRFSTV